MSVANKTPNPILVANPYTGKLNNVEPLFRLLDKYITIEDCYINTDDTIKVLALSDCSELCDDETKKYSITFLYELRDMFKFLQECEISVTKKSTL